MASYANGVRVSEETSMKVSSYYRGVIYLSTQIAKLPWEIKSKDNEVIEGPVSTLLSLAPNPEMNAFKFRLFMVQQAIHHGNAFAEIERDYLNRPVALWPLNTSRVAIIRTETGELVYRYTNPDNGYTYLDPKNVFHLPNFHIASDGRTGLGLVS